MRIALTGASGQVGRYLTQELRNAHEVISFGRRHEDICWSLGVLPDPKSLIDVDIIIHLAWSLRDRIRDRHLNVGGTLLLAQRAQSLGIPFLFISTLSTSKSSHYVSAKLEAEKFVKQFGGCVLRIGLVPDLNSYQLGWLRSLHLPVPIPKVHVPLPLSKKEDILVFLESILENVMCDKYSISEQSFEVVSYRQEFTDYFSKFFGNSIKISPRFFRFALQAMSPFSLKIRNLHDAFLGISQLDK